MKTLIVKVNLADGTSLSQDVGDRDWEEAKSLMRNIVSEMRFFKKAPLSPKAVRLGSTRIILVAFREEHHG
jgi:hypothetical protein